MWSCCFVSNCNSNQIWELHISNIKTTSADLGWSGLNDSEVKTPNYQRWSSILHTTTKDSEESHPNLVWLYMIFHTMQGRRDPTLNIRKTTYRPLKRQHIVHPAGPIVSHLLYCEEYHWQVSVVRSWDDINNVTMGLNSTATFSPIFLSLVSCVIAKDLGPISYRNYELIIQSCKNMCCLPVGEKLWYHVTISHMPWQQSKAKLSWHVRICDLIGPLEWELLQLSFWEDFTYELINPLWNGSTSTILTQAQ